MNIFICPGFTLYNIDVSGIGQGYFSESSNYVILKPTYSNYLGGNNWDAHRLLVHEVNHCIGLHHTFNNDRGSQPFLNDYKCTGNSNVWNQSNHNMMYGGAMIYMSKLQNGHLRRNLLTTWRKKVLVNQSLTNGNHILTENVTINNGQLVVLTDDLYIKTGNTLTVNGLLQMSSNKSIIVERGAKLIVNNGGKISSCNGNWKSIFVEGSPSGQNTHLSTLVTTKSGVVQLNAGSLIENAQTAISMIASHIPWPNTPSYYGGYVYTNQATIQNCGKAIEFMTYARNGAKDQSKIINSTINQCINGISIWANDGVTVQGTTMSNITQTGLYSLDAEVIVNDGSIFNNCQIGLLLNNTINYAYGSDIGFSGISGSTFQNCSTGIRAIAQNTSGTLKIGRNVLYNNSSQGIHIDGIARYFVQNNSITGGNTGVVLNASGTSAGNRVEGNTFFSQQAGMTYGGNNGSSLIIANCFSNYTLAAINGFAGSNVNGLQSINGSSSASNCFGFSSVPTFLNYGTNVHYLWDPSVQCTQPINAVGLTFGMAGNTQNSCIGSYIMSNQSNTFEEQKFNSTLINLKSSINKAQNKAEVEILNIKKFHLLQDWIFNKMSVKNPDLESITNKLLEENDFYSHTLLFSSYISQNNLQNASSLLNKMARSDDQIAIDYVYSQRLMLNYLKNPLDYKISSFDKSKLYEISKRDNPMYGFSRAIYYVLVGEFVTNQKEGEALSQRSKIQSYFNLLPNPANSWIYIDSNKKLSDIKIFSLNGALVYSISLNVEDIKHSINIESLMNGVYLTKITCLDGEVITDKFIKN